MLGKITTTISEKYFHSKNLSRINRGIHFFLPQFCAICGREDLSTETFGICKPCLKRNRQPYPNFDREFCPKCKTFLSGLPTCNYCQSRNVFFESAFFLTRSQEMEKQLMSQLKSKKEKHLSRYFSLGLGRILKNLRKLQPSGIVPIPSHPKSWRERPFYSTLSLIFRISRKLKIPILPVIEKTSQSHQASQNRVERFIHAKHAFKIKKSGGFIHKPTLVLIDDVFTTGSSSNEISRLLLENGAGSVVVVSTIRKTEGIEI